MLLPFILMGIFAPEVFGFMFGENWTEAGAMPVICFRGSLWAA